MYPAMLRLYGLGFVDNVFLGMRPWTRASVSHMLDEAGTRIDDADPGPATDEAQSIYDAINKELNADMEGPCGPFKGKSRIESIYSTFRAVSGTPLNDSFHLGQTLVNDYGRPLQNGFNNYTGVSGYAAAGRFLFYARGEFQRAPSAEGYSPALAQTLASIDTVPFINPLTQQPYNNSTIPMGPIGSQTNGRVVEAYVSAHVLNHEIAFGKQDDWLGPGMGGAFAYSNNAENIYSFRIDRIEPLRIPLLSRLTGPFRYDFLVGSLKGHVAPNAPWIHVEKISFRPTENLEFGFERSVIWGGKGHVPITLHSFLKSFFSFQNVSAAEKLSRSDPGARFGAFDFSYRLPFLRKWVTLYSDSEVHDDVSPIDAPRRAAWRPGIYLSHVPHVPKLDIRLEAATTDPPVSTSKLGRFMYWESIQVQGYTNKGQILGDWMGREGKGGQAWITYHLSGNEWLQASWRNQKVAKDFVPGGTTLNDVSLQVVKRLGPDFEFNGKFAYQHWKAPAFNSGAPVYPASEHNVTTTTIQLTWFPGEKKTY
ncbi:MAG: capsule assembly Wzi family protein [Acidobacteriota bacterium]|nr:capsule assembly Wzi family protein [Acidobacteriota bacterium]